MIPDRIKFSHGRLCRRARMIPRLLAMILLPPLFLGMGPAAEARPQDKNEAKAAHALYEKAMKKKNAAERIAALRAAAARHPQAAELHYGLGREFYQLGQLDSAAARFELVFALNAALAEKTSLRTILVSAYGNLAGQRLNRGKLIAALEAALAGLRHEANSSSCLAAAAVAYQQLGEYEQALALGLRLLAVQPSAQNHNNVGAAYESKGDWLAAKRHYAEAVALAPHLAEAQNNLNRINTRLAEQTAAPAAPSSNKPDKKQNEARKKLPRQEESPAGGKSFVKNAPRASASKIPPPVAAEKTGLQNPPPAVAARQAPAEKIKAPASSASPPATKPATTSPARNSTPTPASAAKPPAPKEGGWQAFSVWIWGALALALLALVAGSKFFRRPEKERVKKTKKRERVPAAAEDQNAKIEEHEPLLQEAPAATVSAAAVDESLRMLNRLAPAPSESGFFEVNSGRQNGEAGPSHHKDNEGSSAGEDAPAHGGVENGAAGTAADSPPACGENAAPMGLQTEMLFAEMIAGALSSFETPEEEERRAAPEKKPVGAAPADENRVGAVSAKEDFFEIAFAQADAPPHVNGTAENKMADAPAREPGDLHRASTDFPARREDFGEARQQKSLEMTTMGFVAGVEEMMRTPAEGKFFETRPVETPASTAMAASTPVVEERRPFLDAQTIAAGEHRIGRYLIEREIAKAATGRIYKARDPKLDRHVVLKTVQYGFAASSQEIATLKDRIYREARAIAKLSHPNIVIVYDVDDQQDFSYLVMEYLEGRDLKQVLETERRLDCARALHIVMQVCEAMEYAHRCGVFHRDVKPSNIMLLENDETKVTDFGIAKISNYLSLTQTGRVFGTPSYMAPEQIEGQATDGRADLFSLGIVLYELLAGKRPFAADSLAALAYKIVHKQHVPPSLENVEIPIELDEVLQRALAKNPRERYQSAEEFREALARVKAKL